MIAWADWELPENDSAPKSSGGLRGQPPYGYNYRFCGLACDAVEAMRTKVLQGKKCYGMSICLLIEELSIDQLLYADGKSSVTHDSAQSACHPTRAPASRRG